MIMNEFKLESEPKIKSGFEAPENYFVDFSAKVIQRLPENEPKVISIFSRKKTWIYAVAAILIVAVSIPIYTTIVTQQNDLDKTTIENYLTSQNAISDDDLTNLLDEDDIQKMKLNFNIEDKAIEDLLSTQSNLEEYIIN
jgi:flagellar basal body-associated protein FliL